MSKRALKDIRYTINQFIARHKDELSYSSRNSMKERLSTTFRQLHGIGYELRHIKNLKHKHIEKLVSHWKENGLAPGTIKNRMADLRYMCQSQGRHKLMYESNDAYDIERRSYIPQQSKAQHEIDPHRINDPYVQASVRLQQAFGLRREEAIKIKPGQALKQVASGTNYLRLQGSWTKGNIERTIPITNQAQLDAINQARRLAGTGALIPTQKNYEQQMRCYDTVTRQAGLYNLHGLRHAYAQSRYRQLTDYYSKGKGWQCPIAGGPARYHLTPGQKQTDRQVRQQIAEELGHSRVAIVKNYIG